MKNYILFLIIAVMIIIPFNINGDTSIFVYLFSILSIFGIYKQIPGSVFILFAIALCIPKGFASTGESYSEVVMLSSSFGKVIYVLPIFAVYFIYNHYFPNKNKLIVVLSLFVLVGIFAVVNTSQVEEFNPFYVKIGTCYAIMIICFNDKNIKINDAFLFLDILACISLLYGILDFVFDMSPYDFIVESTSAINGVSRARGLLGHPLYLSGFALFYQAALFVRYMINKKIYYLQETVCIILSMIVISRTTVIVFVLEFLCFYVLINRLNKIKSLFRYLAAAIIVILLINYLSDNLIINIMSRFDEGTSSHREGAYLTVMRLFIDNPLGVGASNIMSEVSKGGYATLMFDSYFSTIDNFFLSQIAAYGILAPFTILFYFYFMLDSFGSRKDFPKMSKSIFLLFFPLLLESFSFDWESSRMLCLLHFGFIGFIYKYYYHRLLISDVKEIINNNES